MLPTGYEVTTSGWTKDTTWPNGNAWVSTAKTVTGTTNFTATVAQASTSTTLHIYSPYMIDEYSSSGSFTLNYLGTTNNGYFHYSLPNANGDDVLYVGPDYLWLRDQTFHVYYSGAYVEGFIYKEGTSSMPD